MKSTAKTIKPVGIILTVLYFAIVNGFLQTLASFPLLVSGDEKLIFLGIITLILGVLSFAVCYGLWMLVEWGWKLGIEICIISILFNLISLVEPIIPGQGIILVAANVVIDVLVIFYLQRNEIRCLFSA